MAERKFYRLTNDLMFHIVMQESMENSNLAKEVVETMYKATIDDSMSRWLSDKEILERDRAAQDAYSRKKAMDEGRAEGKAQSRETIRSNMIRVGFSEEQIALALGE